MKERLRLYFQHVRPGLVEQGHDINNLFILPGSQKITNFSNLRNFLKKKLKVDIPCSTKSRKIGATCAAKGLDYQTNTLVTKQMSHGPEVSSKFYEAVHGSKDAAFAYRQMEALREREFASSTRSPQSTASTSKPSTSDVASNRWTAKDTAFIESKFARTIKKRITPHISACEDLGLNKTAKQIQDKVRTIIRQEKKQTEIQTED